MLLFYRKSKKDPKQFKIKMKFSTLPEEGKERLLFQVFDLLLSNKKKIKPKKNQNSKRYPMHFLTKDIVGRLFYVALDSADPANKRQS